MKTVIVLPTYNEKDNVEKMLNTIMSLPNYINVLVVDDNSPDGTSKIVEEYISKNNNNRIELLKREKKQGLGPAYLAGFSYAIKNMSPKYIVEMDCDFSHDPQFVVKFVERMENEGLDLVIGSRYCNGISVVNWPLRRLFLSYYANVYAGIILQEKIKDLTGGFKCFRASALSNMDFSKVLSAGYSFQIEMNNAFLKNKYKVREEPIIFYERREGQSKMSGNIIMEALFRVVRLRLRNQKQYFNS